MKYSKLNAIELNSSFYRFPFKNQVKSWKRKTEQLNPNLRWSIKVNRFITHIFKFSEKSYKTWEKFKGLFTPLEEFIDFYLFQIPQFLKPKKTLENLKKFVKFCNLKERFAFEVRSLEWYDKKILEEIKALEITFVSVDAPEFTKLPREIYSFNKIVYLRMHGRTYWYSHNYSEIELKEVCDKILKSKAKKIYIFFNNNHNMLENARKCYQMLKNYLRE